MGITYHDQEDDGLVRLTLTGLASRTDHAAFTERVAAQIRSGQLRAVIIDASEAELPVSTSFSQDVWEVFSRRSGGVLSPIYHRSVIRAPSGRT